MLSFIHVDFAVHKVFKWLSQNKDNAFNIEAFDLFSVLIISLGFHYAVFLIPFSFNFSSFPWYFILTFSNYFYVTKFKYYIIVILAYTLTLYLNMIF